MCLRACIALSPGCRKCPASAAEGSVPAGKTPRPRPSLPATPARQRGDKKPAPTEEAAPKCARNTESHPRSSPVPGSIWPGCQVIQDLPNSESAPHPSIEWLPGVGQLAEPPTPGVGAPARTLGPPSSSGGDTLRPFRRGPPADAPRLSLGASGLGGKAKVAWTQEFPYGLHIQAPLSEAELCSPHADSCAAATSLRQGPLEARPGTRGQFFQIAVTRPRPRTLRCAGRCEQGQSGRTGKLDGAFLPRPYESGHRHRDSFHYSISRFGGKNFNWRGTKTLQRRHTLQRASLASIWPSPSTS